MLWEENENRKELSYRSRVYVLLLFAWIGTEQCYCWYTFGSLPDKFASYFHLSKDQGDSFATLTLNLGPIVFLPIVPFSSYALGKKGGFLPGVKIAAFGMLICNVLRCIPLFVSPRKHYLFLIYIAQGVNAAVGAIYQCSASLLSALYFPEHQRNTATAVAYTGGNLGMILGYAFGAIFSSGSPEKVVPQLLLMELFISVIPVICVMCYLPKPPHRPSVTSIQSERTFWDELKETAKNGAPFLFLAGGLESGSNASWGGLFPQIFGQRYSNPDAFSNFCGILNCGASFVGMLISGVISDRYFASNLKTLIVLLFFFGTILNAIFTSMFPMPYYSDPLLPAPKSVVSITVFFAGFFQGMLDPLFLELAAQICFPASEGTSAGILTFCYNSAALAVLSIPSSLVVWINSIYTVTFAVCVLLTYSIQEKYLRRDFEKSLTAIS